MLVFYLKKEYPHKILLCSRPTNNLVFKYILSCKSRQISNLSWSLSLMLVPATRQRPDTHVGIDWRLPCQRSRFCILNLYVTKSIVTVLKLQHKQGQIHQENYRLFIGTIFFFGKCPPLSSSSDYQTSRVQIFVLDGTSGKCLYQHLLTALEDFKDRSQRLRYSRKL
jgi:hypothetical protein